MSKLDQLDTLFRVISGGGVFGLRDMIDMSINATQMSKEDRFNRLVELKMSSFLNELSRAEETETMMLLQAGSDFDTIKIEDVIKERNEIETEAIRRLCDGDEEKIAAIQKMVDDAKDPELEAQLIKCMDMCLTKEDEEPDKQDSK